MHTFTCLDLLKLTRPQPNGAKSQNGQITIIGGSDLFHGAPILSLKAASRLVDMVYFSSPHPQFEQLAIQMKSQLSSFIWVPFEEIEAYISKSNAILIGPGMKRYQSEYKQPDHPESFDDVGKKTKEICEQLLTKFPHKQWVIDAGALRTIDVKVIPSHAIITPNHNEFTRLFLTNTTHQIDTLDEKTFKQLHIDEQASFIQQQAFEYNCIIVYKSPLMTIAASPYHAISIPGGNSGLSKGGTGDTLAGVTTALAATNVPLLAAAAASYIVKSAADELYLKMNYAYNSDDLANQIPYTFRQLLI